MISSFAASIFVAALLFRPQASVQESGGAWLDSPEKWDSATFSLTAEPPEGPNSRCDSQLRSPVSAADRLLTSAGWKLSIATQSRRVKNRDLQIVQAFRRYDGMCRPLQFQAFVFVDQSLIGALSPHVMNAREDGQLSSVRIANSGEITATFSRYERSDALCCPSRESIAVYSIVHADKTYEVKLLKVDTRRRAQP